MEEVGPQVASPIFIHQALGGRFHESQTMAKKRSVPFVQGPNFTHHYEPQLQNSIENWNPKAWEWDNRRFVAKPVESDVLHLGTTTTTSVQSQSNHVGKDDESLLLKLGGGGLGCVDENSCRPNKRNRSGSPGNGTANYPMCQVDNCKESLSNAKDYHRRHKVCEAHSKATKALVGKQMQRFCQQCSRFHPLSEFDEGKRSCRRRLAGHNRRRRKTQPEDATSQLQLPGNRDITGNGDTDIVKLLTVLARAQGNIEGRSTNCAPVPNNKDQLIQILSKINSSPLLADFAAKLPSSGNLNKSVRDQVLSGIQNRLNGDTSSSSTMDLLTVLSAALTGSSPDTHTIPSQRSSQGSDSEKTNLPSHDQSTSLMLQKGPGIEFPSVGGERSSTSYQSPIEDSDCQVQETRMNIPLQLFSSSPENHSPPELVSARKYFSSDCSNLMEERSPSSSPPVEQMLFPTQASRETLKPESISTSGTANVKASRTHGGVTSLDLFGGPNRGADNSSFQNYAYPAGYTSSSGSDHSPSSLNSDAQDRTGRIIFKLFDKDPSHMPLTLRTQIYNWLSNSPSEMESYIRPGCVVLSIYLSMSSSAWGQLEENLTGYISSLAQDSNTEFWRNGRFLVQIGRRLASHKDGKVHLFKSWRSWSSPELISVSPLAVVCGQETSLLLKGRNLSTPGTNIYCTHNSGYTVKKVSRSVRQETVYDEISLGSVTINGSAPSVLGRCFIEVENGLRGTSFPIIIADATICKELRLLESDFDEHAKMHDTISENQERPRSREEVLHFLNELGWLFQRHTLSSTLETPDYALTRFKFLFIFSVERDFCALVKNLLQFLLERNKDRDEEVARETLEMLLEIHLLNRAVKRRCRKMVELLIHFSVIWTNDTSKRYIFPPNLVGPGGITPLHLAASTPDSDDMIDALTSDPQEIGLRCWNSLIDANGLSPYAYAAMRNHHSYNNLVARKLADKENNQISVTISNQIEQPTALDRLPRSITLSRQGQNSCSKCAIVASKKIYSRRAPQSLLHRPYIHSMLAIAAVCVCVCLFLRGSPDIGLVAPFKWENLGYGAI